jgi:hypothetical protein
VGGSVNGVVKDIDWVGSMILARIGRPDSSTFDVGALSGTVRLWHCRPAAVGEPDIYNESAMKWQANRLVTFLFDFSGSGERR